MKPITCLDLTSIYMEDKLKKVISPLKKEKFRNRKALRTYLLKTEEILVKKNAGGKIDQERIHVLKHEIYKTSRTVRG